MPNIEALPAASAIGPLIAGALYAATYLSFVRLLRYPRNWLPPAPPASFATAGLGAGAAAYVSLSPDGVDLAALAVVTGFIIGLFCFIAAPAIAFRPAARPIEFLARHGDYAGLWMLAPAAVAGYAIPDPKLQGLLAAAMTIELAWSLRHRRADRRRRLIPIEDHDLSVLRAQAGGDLERFARRHGVRELDLSGGTAAWRGCDKTTLPCPFNLYVNRLGLNTAPCCRRHMMSLCHIVASWLREMGIVHWLEGGTLLGAVRENGTFLAWDDDVDISVLLDRGTAWKSLTAELIARGARDGWFVDIFEKEGHVAISYDPPRRWPLRWERNRMRGEIRLDLVAYRPATSRGEPVLERRTRKGAMPRTEGGGYGVPRDVVLPTSTIAFLGDGFACPNRPEEYLGILYGDFKQVEYTYVDKATAEKKPRTGTAATNRLVPVPPFTDRRHI